jgi:hypothetical protein
MQRVEYKDYLDKVYGCWIGKCVAGTIGAPYEGAKELFDFEYDPEIIADMLPNDDLDLQVLWLAVLEEKGVRFTSDDLADAFLNRCPYGPGEYAYFKKNYARGIHPPLSGSFNNRYYVEGMGCPIRSEIWGCIAPGNPALAAEISAKDGVMDHAGNSVYAEQFLAALEAAAFFESDLDTLVDIGLAQIPRDSKTHRLITDVRNWCKASQDWRYVRVQVIGKYGHPDCTNMPQNIGITLLALYFGGMDIIETSMIALNCGFDTDCTCSTAGAIIGLIQGAEHMESKHGFGDPGFKLGVDAPRRSDRIRDLAEDTCLMGLHFAEHLNKEVAITNAPPAPEIDLPPVPPVIVSVEYAGVPAIGIGDTKRITVRFANTTARPLPGKASLSIPDGWTADSLNADIVVPAGGIASWDVAITVPADIDVLQEKNLMQATFSANGIEPVEYQFGLLGASVWKVFGPFWQNVVEMPPLKLKESYYAHIPGGTKDEYADNGRQYHLNVTVDPAREYMTMDEITGKTLVSGDPAKEGALVNCYEDLISVSDLVGFQGPCAVYAVRRMISPEDRKLCIQVGHTDAYKLWINGDLVSERDSIDWWTAENAHIHEFPMRQGVNEIIVKLIRRGAHAGFSLTFTRASSCSPQYYDFASENPTGRAGDR